MLKNLGLLILMAGAWPFIAPRLSPTMPHYGQLLGAAMLIVGAIFLASPTKSSPAHRPARPRRRAKVRR